MYLQELGSGPAIRPGLDNRHLIIEGHRQAPANTYFRGQDGVVRVSSNSYS